MISDLCSNDHINIIKMTEKEKGKMYLDYVSLNWTAPANLKGTQMPKT